MMLSAPLVTQWYLWKLRTGKLEERKMAAAKLGGIGCRAVPLILNAIKRDLWDERRKMLDLSDPNEAYLWPFAIIGKSAILPLIRALNDPDLARSMAAMAVLIIVYSEEVPSLEKLISFLKARASDETETIEIRSAAAQAVKEIHSHLQMGLPL